MPKHRPIAERPDWWPEGEPWPPPVPPRRSARRRFLWRVARLIFFLWLIVFIGSRILGWLNPWEPGRGPGGDDSPGAFLGIVLVIVLIVMISRSVRRTAAPIGDVMDAADRVAAGDYAVRVETQATGEVGRLVTSFNEMAARLHANEAQRRSLLADVAHELRTPLAVIRGNIEGMIDGVYPRDDAHLAPILDETTVMARLLDDLRTLSMAEAGALRLHQEPTDLHALLDDVIAAFTPRATEAGVRLERGMAALPEIDVDPVRLRQVLENLLANALRYTPPGGGVRLSVTPGRQEATFRVTDTGPGIPPDELPHIFDRFWKSADSSGSGLGLAIAKSLVEAHDGEIRAESRLGKGTTICFTLPLGKAPVIL